MLINSFEITCVIPHCLTTVYRAKLCYASIFLNYFSYFTTETVGPDLIYSMAFLNCQVVVTMTLVLIFVPKVTKKSFKIKNR